MWRWWGPARSGSRWQRISPHRRVRAFGQPMQTWRTRMPPDMRLRSDWEETSLSAPGDRGSISVWSRASGEPRQEPIPLPMFLRYADWFRDTFVPDSDPADVARLDRAAGRFRITTTAGDESDARDRRRGRRGHAVPACAAPVRRGDGRSRRRLRDRAPGLQPIRRRSGDRRRRRPGRAGVGGAGTTGRGRRRGGRPLAPAVVHRPRALPAARPAAAARLPARLSRGRLRPAAAEPPRAASRRVRCAAGGGAPPGGRRASCAPAGPRGCARRSRAVSRSRRAWRCGGSSAGASPCTCSSATAASARPTPS